MNAERWKRFKEVCAAALELPADERDFFLTESCSGDYELLSQVRLAVNASQKSGFLDDPDSFFSSLLPSGTETPAHVFATGSIVARRFKVVRHIARGGMGEVYEAFDSQLGERVALKTIRPDIAQDVRVLEQFKKEVRRTRLIVSKHVCRVHDLFVYRARDGSEVTFFSMKLLEGETLAQRLKAGGPFPTEAAFPVAQGIADGLGAAHEARIVHGDLKPSNIMLTAEGAVLTDFGLARRILLDDSETVSLSNISSGGTPAYMAPEQVIGQTATAATDIYSFGLILYEMVTGRKPFTGANAGELATARLHQDPPKPRSIVHTLPLPWEKIVLRCLERDPGDRFSSVFHVSKALEEAMAAPPPAVNPKRRPTGWQKLTRGR